MRANKNFSVALKTINNNIMNDRNRSNAIEPISSLSLSTSRGPLATKRLLPLYYGGFFLVRWLDPHQRTTEGHHFRPTTFVDGYGFY
jgi:hypothetical protein